MIKELIFANNQWHAGQNGAVPISGTIKAGSRINPNSTSTATSDLDVPIYGFVKKGAYIKGQTLEDNALDEDCYLVPKGALSRFNTASFIVPVSSFRNLKWGGKSRPVGFLRSLFHAISPRNGVIAWL